MYLILILYARIQSLKKSRVVAIESFSIEVKNTIVHKCSEKRCYRNNGAWVENLHIKTVLQILWL